MKLSTRARYGARAMLELALNYGDNPVLVKNIAKNQEIKKSFQNSFSKHLGHFVLSIATF